MQGGKGQGAGLALETLEAAPASRTPWAGRALPWSCARVPRPPRQVHWPLN